MSEILDGLPVDIGSKDFDGQLVDALTSRSPEARVFGRSIASGWMDTLQDWLNAERERGTKPGDVLFTLATLQVQTFASVTAHMAEPGGFKHALELYEAIVAKVALEHMQRCAALMAERAA